MASKTAESRYTVRIASDLSQVPIDTLRKWERRYGFPRGRDGQNRRVYSPHDVERLRWIARAIRLGHRAGDVVPLGIDDLRRLVDKNAPQPPKRKARTRVEELMTHLREDDMGGFERELASSAMELGPKRFVIDVAHPLAVAIGEAWARGDLPVRQEHVASECLGTELRAQIARRPSEGQRPLVLLATLPGESHALGLLMVATYLVDSGAAARIIGVHTPATELAEAARALRADVVGLTVTPACDADEARRGLHELVHELPRRVPVWLGGGAARRIARGVDAVHVVDQWSLLDDALARFRQEDKARNMSTTQLT